MAKHTLKILAGVSSLIAVAGINLVSVVAQDTTNANLTIDPGALTMYAGDGINNNDLCPPADAGTYNFKQDDGTTASVTCGAAERSVTLTSLEVLSNRQITTATIHDVLCEDLTGSLNNTYSVSATINNLVNQGAGSDILLGSNPDGMPEGNDLESDAPQGTNNGLLYATYTPGTDLKAIEPESARGAADADFTAGAKTTVINTTTSIGVYSTAADTNARRFDSDNNTIKYRIPAFPDADSYLGGIVYTCTAS